MEKALPAPPPARLDVVLYPNRSLGRAGFAVLMAAIALVSGAVGAGFVMVGAWPVTGFLGLDVVLLYLAFRWNYRQARRAEFVRLDRDGLSVRRLEPDGRTQSWRFEPYWVRVCLEHVGRHEMRLVLRSHGRQVVIGAFLTQDERVELAQALEAALWEHRADAPSAVPGS
jgi:uncharacterized membrane protein